MFTRICNGAALCLLVGLVGCSKTPLPPETDAKTAKTAMVAALDAWKDGKTAASLQQQSPAIDFRDTFWEKGSKLTKYTIQSEERSGLSVKFTVQLSLQDKDGPARDRTVVYNVDAGTMVVIRPNF